jgi:DNA polymerase-3 subunit epsilon
VWPFRSTPQSPIARQAPAAARYAVIDSELTGLDPRRDSIVSLGGLRLTGGRIVLADRFYEEVQPASALTATSIVLHGITPDDVRGRPGIGAVLQEFAAFCATDILVGHFIELDLGFLRAACSRPACPDRQRGARHLAAVRLALSRTPDDGGPGLRGCRTRLPALAPLGVPGRGEHNALGDAFVTAQVFQRLLRRLGSGAVTTTGDLLRIGDPKRPPQPGRRPR